MYTSTLMVHLQPAMFGSHYGHLKNKMLPDLKVKKKQILQLSAFQILFSRTIPK